jgi:glucokinase
MPQHHSDPLSLPLQVRVLVVNDFLALGYGLLTLNIQDECVILHTPLTPPSTAGGGGTIACIGAGTGLGECFLTAHAVTSAATTTTSSSSSSGSGSSGSSSSGSSSSGSSSSGSSSSGSSGSSSSSSSSGSDTNYEYQCFACEGGHAEFSPRNDVEYGLLKFLKKKYAHEGSQNRFV